MMIFFSLNFSTIVLIPTSKSLAALDSLTVFSSIPSFIRGVTISQPPTNLSKNLF